MRGDLTPQASMLSLLTPEQLVPSDHPIRRIKTLVDRALQDLSPTFDRMYAPSGRPSIPPERLLKGCLLIALYSIRSERQFCERLQYDLLFKWFLDLEIGDPPFDATTFTKNRERLVAHEVAGQFFQAVLQQARQGRLISDDHFTVDGTLLEAWASHKSLRPREGEPAGPGPGAGSNPDVNFRGQPRTNQSHQSTTDPEARLARKGIGREARLCLAGHVLMENRNGLVVDVVVTQATGTAERQAAIRMLARFRRRGRRKPTLGADKGYDSRDFIEQCRVLGVTPHVASKRWWSAVDQRLVRRAGYRVSQRVRKRVEEIFGWVKTVGGGRKLRYVGVRRNQLWAELTTTAYNLVRMANLLAEAA